MTQVKTGLDLISQRLNSYAGKKIAILAHAASVTSNLNHLVPLLIQNPKIHFSKIFSPEHGLWGNAQDMENVAYSIDPLSQKPIISLYGRDFDSLSPKISDLHDVDILICDLQDVGARYYTFIYSMALCMSMAAKTKTKIIVLDRPNPLNGQTIEGPLLKKGYESFVGLYPLPVRHGMTIGELALYFKDQGQIDCDLEIIPLKNWNRSSYFDETGLPWVAPSPNMPTLATALVYPGACLIEATGISEGRGTTRPFEFIGAPFINAFDLADALNTIKLPGVIFRPIHFCPTFQKLADLDCRGIQIHVKNRNQFQPFLTGIALLKTIFDLYPNHFEWRNTPYEFVSKIPAIDLLYGSNELRKHLEEKTPLTKIASSWKKEVEEFKKIRRKYLLY